MSDTRDEGPDESNPSTGWSSSETQDLAAALDRAADVVIEHRDSILNRWLELVIRDVPSARDKSRSELADHAVDLLTDLVRDLRKVAVRSDDTDLFDLSDRPSSQHGRERAALEGYTIPQLAYEYVALRRVIIDVIFEQGLDNRAAIETVSRVIEKASLTSVTAFASSLREVQQKLISTLVHDVRTPMGVARSYGDLLSFPNISEDQRLEAAEAITRSLSRAQSMLEELLDATRVGAGQGLYMRFHESDIDHALQAVCKEASQVYSKGVVANLPGQPVVGVFDLGLVVRTVENLVSNAVKFGASRAPITVSLEDMGEHVNLRVHNQGEPISRHEINRIFRFFYSPDHGRYSSQKGWGLGLSLIKVVAKSHGGEVIAESSEEAGTTFGMVLPKHYRRDGDAFSVLF